VKTFTVCDREAGFYDFFNETISKNTHLLVSVTQKKRYLNDGSVLMESIEKNSVIGNLIVDIPKDTKNNLSPRAATLSIRYSPICISVPQKRKKKESLSNLKLYFIFTEEINPKKEVAVTYNHFACRVS